METEPATAATSRGPTTFLHLARELRDMIYKDYLTVDGGYVFNPTTWKLKRSNNNSNPHPFALQHTCRLIASEMRGLALTHNLITFTPIETMPVQAFQFEWLVDIYTQICCRAVRGLAVHEYKEGKLPESVKATLLRHRLNLFEPAELDALFSDVAMRNHSEVYGFTRLLMTQPEFAPFWHKHGAEDFLRLDLFRQPWKAPPQDELNRLWQLVTPMADVFCRLTDLPFGGLESVLRTLPAWLKCPSLHPQDRFKYRFSATAAAIGFLQSLEPSVRLYMRRLRLDENTDSVMHPERHGKGLVEFCNENPRLAIERRVSLWRTILPQLGREYRRGRWDDGLLPPAGPDQISFNWGEGRMPSRREISRAVAHWVHEALCLPRSVSLVIDDEPLPQLSSQIFGEIVVKDAVWQGACEKAFASGRLETPPYWAWRCPQHYKHIQEGPDELLLTMPWQDEELFDHCGYTCEDFPSIMRDILTGSSPVSVNFHVGGDPFDQQMEDMLSERLDWRNEDWYAAWRQRHDDKWITPTPPLAEN
ncbi:hypothetical protein V8F06_007643 [Rhypophila decipiens]